MFDVRTVSVALPLSIVAFSALLLLAFPLSGHIIMLCILVVAVPYLLWRRLRKPLIEANASAALGGIEAIGPLLEMLDVSVYVRDVNAIHAALTPRLLEVKSCDVVTLSRRQRFLLHRHLQFNALSLLEKPDSINFCVAILAALEYIGGAQHVPIVERIATMRTLTAGKRRIRDTAAQCLPLLKTRLGLVAQSQVLLRASAPDKVGRDTFLRPADDAQDTKPEELLHPSEGSEAGGWKGPLPRGRGEQVRR